MKNMQPIKDPKECQLYIDILYEHIAREFNSGDFRRHEYIKKCKKLISYYRKAQEKYFINEHWAVTKLLKM